MTTEYQRLTPSLTPLELSFSNGQDELDLKSMFIRVFKEKLSPDFADADVSGAAHLGSFSLIKRMISLDGLVLLHGDVGDPETRFLYRAWKAEGGSCRGFHFLRLYLQLMFPGGFSIDQLWHEKDAPYPTALYKSNNAGNTRFLTSRVRITIEPKDVSLTRLKELISIIRSIIPARITPEIVVVASSYGSPEIASSYSFGVEFLVDNFVDAILVLNENVLVI